MTLKLLYVGTMFATVSVVCAQGRRLEYPAELKDAFAKAKNLRFSGTRSVTFIRAGKVETHNEYVTKDGANMRIEFAAGSPFAGQIIVETSDSRKHYFPDKNEIHEYPSFGKKQFEGFVRNYRGPRGGNARFDSSFGGVIAGLRCTKWQLSDGSNNPMVQLFVEPKSGMITKRVIFDPTGNVAGSFEFVSLTMDPKIQPGAFKIFRKGATIVRPIDELRKNCGTIGVPALTLPRNSGYRLEASYVREIKGSKVLVQSYGNEESRLTMFLTKSTMNASDFKRFNRGELASYVRTLNGVTVVLMGDQTEDKLRSLASQVSE